MARRGFTLPETLVSLVLLSLAGLLLLEGGRWFLLSSQRLSSWLLARGRGQRVLAFIEPRVLHCGLGLGACWRPGALQRALGKGTLGAPPISRWSDSLGCLVVYDEAPPSELVPVQAEDGVFRGTALSCLYSRSTRLILGRTQDAIAPGKRAVFKILSGGPAYEAGFSTGYTQDLRSWGTLTTTGMPFFIVSDGGTELTLRLSSAAPDTVALPLAGELSLLQCDRFRVIEGVFRFQGMTTNWYPAAFYPREEGILALWCEWRPGNPSLDLWVLASGGPAVFGSSSRPAEWPEEAPWRAEFERHELCVSRASWRPENL